MKNKSTSLKNTTDKISKEVPDRQSKNKTWWETLPMTYANWDSDKRIPQTKEDFLKVEKLLLDGNPFLRDQFNFKALKGKKVLEIGCGSGAASCLFAKGGAIMTSVDITGAAINLTKANTKAQGLSLTAIQQDAEKLDFKDETFDYVFSWGVLHHSQKTENAFREVSRVLKRGGTGLIMVYNKNSLRYYVNGLYWLLFRGKILKGYNLERVQEFYTDGYYHRHFTPQELKKTLRSSGLLCKKISITHMGTQMVPLIPPFLRNWLKRRFGWLLVEEFYKK